MKILALADSPMQSGFGRISNQVFTRLVQRGHQVHVASLLWDGIAVDGKDWYRPLKHELPFQISGCAGRDIYSLVANLNNILEPDVIMSVQDFPYAHTLFYGCHIDWSRRAMVVITPIDGEPIFKDWLQLVDDADGTLVISQFGVDAMKRAGRRVGLCPPGIDHKYFTPASPEERLALRHKAGIQPDAFVLGMMAMNQGRKDIPHTLDGFWKFAIDKPNAFLLLDMDKVSPAGWNIPELMETKGIPVSRVLFKDDIAKRGVSELRDRFSLLDAHSVLAHREGFGLPLVEGQSMGIPSIAMDWCSGTEICGEGKGYLVRRLPQPRNSTWGNAYDYDPDVDHFAQILEQIYNHPEVAKGVAAVGQEWARARSWDIATDNVEKVLLEAEKKKNARISGNPRVQRTAQGAEVMHVNPSTPPKESETDSPGGRLLDGVQSAGVSGTPVLGGEVKPEPGLRENGEQRREDDGRGTPTVLKF